MKKNWLFKVGLIVFSFGFFCPFFASATVFHLTGLKQIYALSPDKILDNMMYVHFADGVRNDHDDFGGFLYFANNLGEEENTESTDLFEVTTDSEKSLYECRSQVKGFYYNAQRGERLWPLDAETWSGLEMQGLEMTGGIYTLCAQSGYQAALKGCEDGNYAGCPGCDYNECVAHVRNNYSAGGYGYYGGLEQKYSGDTYNLVMGVNYDASTNGFITIESGSDLASTFVRLNNKFPVGFIYDNKGGLGLAGCMFTSLTGGSMKNLVREVKNKGIAGVFRPAGTGYIEYYGDLGTLITCTGISFQDRLTKILIEGIMGLSNSGTGGDTKFGTIGNSSDTKMQYFATKSVSNVTMMNYARRRSELLCRGKWTETSPVGINASGEKIICLDGVDVGSGIAIQAKEHGKTLIVKNGNVTISPMQTDGTDYYDIFILSGNLLIDEENANKFVINNKGFVDGGKNTDDFRQSVIKGELLEMAPTIPEVIDMYLKCLGEECTQEDYDECTEEGIPLEDCNCKIEGNPNFCRFWMDVDGDGFIKENDKEVITGMITDSLNGGNSYDLVSVASVLRGNFIVNGNVKSASGDVLDNKYFFYGKFTTKDTIDTLENVFAWRCDNESGSDGYFCPKFHNNPYRNASLVVIDQNYSSPLLQS